MTTVPRRTATRRSVYIPTRCSVSRQAERLGGPVTVAVDTSFINTPLTATEADKPGRAEGGKADHFGRHSHLQMVRSGLQCSRCVGGDLRGPLAVPDGFGVSDQHHL